MTSNFSILFNLKVVHTYYKQNTCRDLVFQPDERTKSIMNGYGFKVLENIDGFSVIYNTYHQIEDALSYIETVIGLDYFCFNAFSKSPNFYAITAQLPLDKLGYLSYTNHAYNKENNNYVLTSKFETQTSNNSVIKIKLYFKDIIDNTLNNNQLQYNIKLDARATQWHYNIINISQHEYEALDIVSTSDITFNQKPIVLNNGQDAICFSSQEHQITLKEVPEYLFNLVSKRQKMGKTRIKTLFKGLPYPKPNTLTINNSTKVITSLAYVYI